MVRRMYENLWKVGLDLEGLPGYGVGGAALNRHARLKVLHRHQRVQIDKLPAEALCIVID